MSPTRETPYVGKFPVPWWDEHFRRDEEGVWCFVIPHTAADDELWLILWGSVHSDIIACYAEVAWRKRAERYREARQRLIDVDIRAARGVVRAYLPTAKWANAFEHCEAVHAEAECAVGACREWGER